MLDPNVYKEFIIKFNRLSEEERNTLYQNKDFVMKIFTLEENKKAALMLFLSKAPIYMEPYIYFKDIVDSILYSAPFYKIEYIVRFCKTKEIKEEILSSTKLLSYLAHDVKNFPRFAKFTPDFLYKILYQIIEERLPLNLNLLLTNIEIDVENYIMKEEEKIKEMIESSKDVEILFSWMPNRVEYMTNSPILIESLLKRDLPSFYHFFDGKYKYSDSLLLDERIQNKLAQCTQIEGIKNNPYLFRRVMLEMYSAGNNALALEQIEEKRKKNIESLLMHPLDISLEDIKEYLGDYFFEEYLSNTLENIEIVLSASLESDEWLKALGPTSIQKVKEFYEIIMCNKVESLQDFFNENKGQNYTTLLYDLLYKVRSLASLDIKNSLTKVQTLKQCSHVHYQDEIPIIELLGENFSFLIHKSKNRNINETLPYEPMTSLSLITEKNIESEYELEDSFIFGYDDIDIQNIVHICESDSFSLIDDAQNTTVYKKPLYAKKSTLIEKTDSYNEIVALNRYNGEMQNRLKPTFLLVYDEVTEKDLMVAKINQLPIVEINREFYKEKNVKNHL